jgi:hypothetical protein
LVALAAVACSAPGSTEEGAASAAALSAPPATIIVTTAGSKNAQGKLFTSVQLGFEDSSFDGDTKSFCFVGKASDVCPEIQDYAKQMDAAYAGGAHDEIEIEGCTVGALEDGVDVASVKYHLTDDYGGDIQVDKAIVACDVAMAQSAGGATTIYVGSVRASGDATKPLFVSGGVGFEDSSFDGDDKAFCYTGKVGGVCGEISAYATEMNKEYADGAHDTIAVKSCAVAGTKVTATYHLSDDYGGELDESRDIEHCYVQGSDDGKK